MLHLTGFIDTSKSKLTFKISNASLVVGGSTLPELSKASLCFHLYPELLLLDNNLVLKLLVLH